MWLKLKVLRPNIMQPYLYKFATDDGHFYTLITRYVEIERVRLPDADLFQTPDLDVKIFIDFCMYQPLTVSDDKNNRPLEG